MLILNLAPYSSNKVLQNLLKTIGSLLKIMLFGETMEFAIDICESSTALLAKKLVGNILK